ncbi:hypothetical protein GWK47_016671 [Chionoecetes opilio]|uniref:Uncharacterized protein n=1 Tax=Chionoecetes opilio TaxID=41210 RepID=A0A8J4XRD4_CHIOP|nr:hypothetical protein GWK47_016671 [Chionoecetes opilio]
MFLSDLSSSQGLARSSKLAANGGMEQQRKHGQLVQDCGGARRTAPVHLLEASRATAQSPGWIVHVSCGKNQGLATVIPKLAPMRDGATKNMAKWSKIVAAQENGACDLLEPPEPPPRTIEHFLLQCPRFHSHRVVLQSQLLPLNVITCDLPTLLAAAGVHPSRQHVVIRLTCAFLRKTGQLPRL